MAELTLLQQGDIRKSRPVSVRGSREQIEFLVRFLGGACQGRVKFGTLERLSGDREVYRRYVYGLPGRLVEVRDVEEE